jgi:hypothetical protein
MKDNSAGRPINSFSSNNLHLTPRLRPIIIDGKDGATVTQQKNSKLAHNHQLEKIYQP